MIDSGRRGDDNAKYKGAALGQAAVSGEPTTPAEVTAWEKIRELASRFQRADRIVMGPRWNFSFPYKLKQLIDLCCRAICCLRSTVSATAPRSTSRRHLSHSFAGKATRLDLKRFRSPGSSI